MRHAPTVLAMLAALLLTGCSSGPGQSSPSPPTTLTSQSPFSSLSPSPSSPSSISPSPSSPQPAPTRFRQRPTAQPSTPAAESLCRAPKNPYHLNLCGRGSLVYKPPSDVCAYFDCIANFSNGTGYMVQCQDGMYSMSGGLRGACSHHDGVRIAVTRG